MDDHRIPSFPRCDVHQVTWRAARLLGVFATIVLYTPSSKAAVPTNDAAAFRMFHLYNDRTASMNTFDHLNFNGYPASLASPPPLLVMRPTPGSADTLGLFSSFAKDAIYFEVNVGPTLSFSSYGVSPTQYATSLGTLLMGVNIYNGTGQFADFGKELARATVTYADGDTTVARLNVGTYVRDYFDSGPLTCGPNNYPLFTTRPTDSRSAYIYETGGNYFDAQEFALPRTKWRKKISSIRFDGTLLDHTSCPFVPHIYAGSRFSGFSIWPSFTVRNADDQPVVRKSQSTNQPHGGYRFGAGAVGTRRTTNLTACQVASTAMSYEYAGFPCTVDGLNVHLQNNRGYEPSNVAIVTWVSPTGDAIRYRAHTQDDTKLSQGDRFLVERDTYTNPLATYEVTTLGNAIRVQVHNAGTPVVVGDAGRVYWNMIRRVADTFPSYPTLSTSTLGSSAQLADQVEALLVQEVPVQLNLVTHGHVVVADGWVPSYRPDGSTRGTYSIKDPYEERNFTRLIQSRLVGTPPRLANYANRFRLGWYVLPPGSLPPLAVDSSAVAGGPGAGLSVLTNGTWRVELSDPLGRRMIRDAGTGEDISEIPGAWIMDVGSEHDNGADWDDSQTGYSIVVPQALDGQYQLSLNAQAGHALNASSFDETGVLSSDAAGDTAVVPLGSSYDVHYVATTQTVNLTFTGSVGVDPRVTPSPRNNLGVRRNPASGPVDFLVGAVSADGDMIDVFDIGGRRVDMIRVDAGSGVVSWSWSKVGCGPGVYLARLRSGAGSVRFVIVR